MSIRTRPGAEAFRFDAGTTGALLLHGFTGSPASTRPLGEYLFGRGMTVVGPRLAGHGGTTQDLGGARWPDWERETAAALQELRTRCTTVAVVGVSFGAALALHLAATSPADVAALVLINPYVRDPRIVASPLLRWVVPSVKSIGNDIKKPGQDEICNERIPVRTLPSVAKAHRIVQRELGDVRAPMLVFSATDDHTVKPDNSRLVMDRVGSQRKELVTLTNSYHVATLDYDADLINQRTYAFLESVGATG